MEHTAARPQERRFRGHTLATAEHQDAQEGEIFVTRTRDRTVQKTPSYYAMPDESWKDRLRNIPDVKTLPYMAGSTNTASGAENSPDERLVFTRVDD